MSLFADNAVVDNDELKKILKKHWNIDGNDLQLLKSSQNVTFKVNDGQWIVRVTRDTDDGVQFRRAQLECDFVNYLASHKTLNVCSPIGVGVVREQIGAGVPESYLVVVVSRVAVGKPLDYASWHWMNDERIVVAEGRWLARLHALSKQYAREFPQKASAFRQWDELHSAIMRGVALADVDRENMTNPDKFGVIHSDINPTNFFFDSNTGEIDVFDWDQVSRAWFAYDVAQPIFGVLMLKEAGSPIDFKPVETNIDRFTEWMVNGYEEESKSKIDRDELQRMIELRRLFYFRFCERAVDELGKNCPPALQHMLSFCQFIVAWRDRVNAKK